jgi:hypothetical protein
MTAISTDFDLKYISTNLSAGAPAYNERTFAEFIERLGITKFAPALLVGYFAEDQHMMEEFNGYNSPQCYAHNAAQMLCRSFSMISADIFRTKRVYNYINPFLKR